MTRTIPAADLFCGAGGMTLGAVQSGRVDVRLALNHWKVAIDTHSHHHPGTLHIHAAIQDVPLVGQSWPRFELLMGGIECIFHSNARGAIPIDDQRRMTAWRVLDWISAFRPAWCVFENVPEFTRWGPVDAAGRKIKEHAGTIFRAWVNAIRANGYHVEWQVLNSANYGEATSRNRLFIVCRRGYDEQPLRWPEATHMPLSAYLQASESERAGRQPYRAAAEAIDWSRPTPSIFTRRLNGRRPLVDNTLLRIEAGLRRCVEPFVATFRGTHAHALNGHKRLDGPLGTITAGGIHHGLAVPFLSPFHGTADHLARSPRLPMSTITGADRQSLVVPYLVRCNNTGHGQKDLRTFRLEEPMRTITASPSDALVLPMTSRRLEKWDVPMTAAMSKLLRTMGRMGVQDIGFRMLEIDELAEAQGFGRSYYLAGTRRDQIRQVGNAVCPKVMRAICSTMLA